MFEPKIIGFLCTWCSYTGADLAGTARLKSPWNLRSIRVPCSGRVSPELIMRAFDEGADGVLVLGCHIGECHYDTGNHRAAKRIPILQSMMAFAGLEPERLQLDWVSASEGERFSHLVNSFTDTIRDLGPVKWRVDNGEWPLETEDEIKIGDQIKEIGRDWANLERINDIQNQIHTHCRDLLENQAVDCVIGYERGTRGRTRPTFIYNSEDIDRLIWDQSCTHNLTTYLEEKLTPKNNGNEPPKVAVLVKPCDSKAINVLTAENKIDRKRVHVVGVVCDGIKEGAGFDLIEEKYQIRCTHCSDRVPIVYDTLIGEPFTVEVDKDLIDVEITKLNSMLPEERASFWLSQFDRCIRCYACRQVCPMCSCPTCLYERDDSLWVGMNIELNQVRTFHLGRAYHLAGRCVGCNECERVCPMDIPISLLNQKLVNEMENAYSYHAGLEPIMSPITTVLGGEEN
jgi:coenzyme F420-reducing hydrogenase delta subunit/ferredoxin